MCAYFFEYYLLYNIQYATTDYCMYLLAFIIIIIRKKYIIILLLLYVYNDEMILYVDDMPTN